jgi:hypothetical protein
MNATEAISELEKRGGVADKEWQGKKLEMKTEEERAAAWSEGAYDEDLENPQEEGKNNGVDNRFEIEIDETKTKRQNSPNTNILDPLQRQRPVAKAVF